MTSEERTSLLSQEQDLEDTDLAKNAGLVETKKILGLPASTISIIIVEFCERFAFYGSSLCFTIYMLQMLNLSYEAVDAVQNGFLTWSYLCALLGGYLGDSSFGKVKTILVFSCTYLCGLLILTASSLPLAYGEYPNRPTTILAYGGFYAALFLIGMGTGGIKSNVSVLVAEQIENPEDVERAFRYFYWSINAGALLGQLIVPFLHHHGPLMKDRFGALQGTSFWMSFLAPTLLFLIGIAVFIHGIPTYTQSTQTDKSVLIRSWNILKKAIGNRKIPTLQPCHWLDKALLHASTDPPPSVQDISLVMDLKEVFHASKIFAVFPIYWLLYNQMQTSFIQQGLQMQTPKWLTADQLNIVDPFCILLLIPFFDSVVFPFLRSRGIHLGFISRISIGFIFSGVALFYSAALQYQINQEGRFINGEYHPTVPMSQRTSLFQQIPPYALIAISEIFASVTALELSYSQAPKTMKSVVMSLFLLTNAFGSILGIFVAPFMGAENLFMAFLWLGITMVLFAIFFYFSFRNHMRTVRETPSFLQE